MDFLRIFRMQEPIAKNHKTVSAKKTDEKSEKSKKKESKTSKELEELKNEKTILEEQHKQLSDKIKLINMTGEEFHKIMECYVEFFKMTAMERQSLIKENNVLKEKVANLDTAINSELLKLDHAKDFIEELVEKENQLRIEIDHQDEIIENMETRCNDLKYHGVLKAAEINSKINEQEEKGHEVTKLRTKLFHNHAKINVLAKQLNNNDKGYLFAPLRNSIAKS